MVSLIFIYVPVVVGRLTRRPVDADVLLPEPLLPAPEGADPVLAAGRAAAARWFGLVEVPLAVADALRSQTPSERTSVARRWEPLEVAALIEGRELGLEGAATAHARAEILQLDDGSFTWTVDLSAAADGPWEQAGTGRQQGLRGEQAWDLRAVAEAFGGEAPAGTLEASTVDEDPDAAEPRSVDAELRGIVAEPWQLLGPDGIGFAADLALTEDGRTWPAAVVVFHALDVGGVGAGVVQQGTTELAFTACWDGLGATRCRTGDAGIAPDAGPPCQ